MKIVHVIGSFQQEYGYEEYYTAVNHLAGQHLVDFI